MKNPYRKKETPIVSDLIKVVKKVLEDENLIKMLSLNTNVEMLKQAIPIIIKNEPKKFVELYEKCLQLSVNTFYENPTDTQDDKYVVVLAATVKFIKEIDNITTCIEVKPIKKLKI